MPLTLEPTQPTFRREAISLDFNRALAPMVAACLGFFLQFNIMTSNFGLPFLRVTDALLFLLLPCLFITVGLTATARYGVAYFFILCTVVLMALVLKTAVAAGDTYYTLIFFLSAVFSFYFAFIASENENVLIYFSIGTLLGLVPSLIVLFLQAGGNSSLPSIGLGVRPEDLPERASLLGTVKFGGMWVHGNEAGHVYALALAPALYLTLKWRRPMIYIAAYVCLIASFAVTLNRAGLIAPTIGLIFCYARLGNYSLYVKSAVAVAVAGTLILSYADIPNLDTFYETLQSRFLEDSNTDNNVSERLTSNLAGIQIALENPFGIGIEERVVTMMQKTSSHLFSIHNGFLSFAYQCSLFVPIAFAISGIYLWRRRQIVSPFYVITFLFAATSMMFEEVSINQAYVFAVPMIIAAAWIQYYKYDVEQRRTRTVPLHLGFRKTRSVDSQFSGR
ncbi:hypothetical protein [Bradyrhizobium sp. 1]|uniref:hypothetical protein n=1 Tax=Bradyrhizobium sp. 1 TaxID=241591 RepID=UPI001FF78A59|nr:hypothetical protein [Bradyrhizobium sp. 1]MCK1396142.1 hypothetical protein [Bradyrhizobium sp. 1]